MIAEPDRNSDRWTRRPCRDVPTSRKRVDDVGHGPVDLQHRLGVVPDPLRVVLDVRVRGLHIIRFRDHQAVAAIGRHVMGCRAGSLTLPGKDVQQLFGLRLAEERLYLLRRDEDHAVLSLVSRMATTPTRACR